MQTKHIILALVVTLAMAASAQVVLPNTAAVPGTLQCLAIMLLGSFMGMRAGLVGAAIYVAGGALGIPWFSGMDADMTTTGGYIVGFIPAIMIVGLQADKGNLTTFTSALGTFVIALLVIYMCGLAWLISGTGLTYHEAVATGVQPTLAGDIAEALLAAVIVNMYHVVTNKKAS